MNVKDSTEKIEKLNDQKIKELERKLKGIFIIKQNKYE